MHYVFLREVTRVRALRYHSKYNQETPLLKPPLTSLLTPAPPPLSPPRNPQRHSSSDVGEIILYYREIYRNDRAN